MKLTYATISKTGKRTENQDTFNVIEMPEKDRWMGIVCDGMGGHRNGKEASALVTKTISDYWEKFSNMFDREEKVVKACKKASTAFDRKSFDLHTQMGTTMVMASVEGSKVLIAHIGDSRCYLLRQGHYDYDDINNTEKDHVVYLTKDHVRTDYGWEVVDKCFFSYRPEVAVADIAEFEIKSNDRLFLCSDGIYKSMDNETLKELILSERSPQDIIDAIDSICERDGNDNYTAIMVRID